MSLAVRFDKESAEILKVKEKAKIFEMAKFDDNGCTGSIWDCSLIIMY